MGSSPPWVEGIAMTMTFVRPRTSRGAFRGNPRLSAAERLAILADVALRFDCADVADLLAVRPSEVDFVPAAMLLDAMDQDQERLEFWLGRGPRLTFSLADTWVQEGVWRRQPSRLWSRERYVDVAPWVGRRVTGILREANRNALEPGDDPQMNALTAILHASRMLSTGELLSQALIAGCGTASWLLQRGTALLAIAGASPLQQGPSGSPGV